MKLLIEFAGGIEEIPVAYFDCRRRYTVSSGVLAPITSNLILLDFDVARDNPFDFERNELIQSM